MPRSQTQSGKTWEYALASQLAMQLPLARLTSNVPCQEAKGYYDSLSDGERYQLCGAASAAAGFLLKKDTQLQSAVAVTMQTDQRGQSGDVRDIIVKMAEREVGISAKVRHWAIKHPRLSATIDFGAKWYDRSCSEAYWVAVRPVFAELRRRKGGLWKSLQSKEDDYYLPVLRAFMKELHTYAKTEAMVSYLLGRHDFYKIVMETGSVHIKSFNLYGGLSWGRKVPLPTRIVEIHRKLGTKTTAVMIADHGWSLSFRIHNASSKIEPSLKLDIKLIGEPTTFSKHEIEY